MTPILLLLHGGVGCWQNDKVGAMATTLGFRLQVTIYK